MVWFFAVFRMGLLDGTAFDMTVQEGLRYLDVYKRQERGVSENVRTADGKTAIQRGGMMRQEN